MTQRSILRWVPAVTVVVLLALAAAPREQVARLGPAPPALALFSTCDQPVQASPGDSTFAFSAGGGVCQPLVADAAVAACSLTVQASGWCYLRLTVREWDPLTLAPDARTVALRTTFLNPSDLQYYTLNRAPNVPLASPVITRSVPGVADPPRSTLVVDMAGESTLGGSFEGVYERVGAGDLPEARQYTASGPRPALIGAHPVLAHVVCGGGGELEDLRVAQAVSRTDAMLSPSPTEVLQAFRVPERVELRSVELAVGPFVQNTFQTAQIGIIEEPGWPTPAPVMPSPLVQAFFQHYMYSYELSSHWGSDLGFDHTLVLEPGHDYWLRVTLAQSHAFFTRTLDGSESAAFLSAIGGLYTRDASNTTTPWTQQPGRALSFKIIGLPTAPVTVPPVAERFGFALRVRPNPARGVADVSWSGAVGPVRLEVLDARGRRVATGDGGAAGSWQWARSSIMPAGVYFVHARDSQGGRAVERLVIVR